MVSVVKSEWHQVEKRYGAVIDADILQEIYPDHSEQEIQDILKGLEDGSHDIDTVINDAWDNDIELEWEYLNQDDWWTDRKGGYEITYNVEEWEYKEDYVAPKTHKCTKCKWTGASYESEWLWEDKDGNELSEPIKVCPMCDSETELTEVGLQEEQRRKELAEELKKIEAEVEDEEDKDLVAAQALEELKKDFEALVAENPNQAKGDTKEFTIKLYGYGSDRGIAAITKEQYEYWSDEDNEMDLGDALNDSYDYEGNETPEEAKLPYEYYNEYTDAGFWTGPEEPANLYIEDEDGNELVDEELTSYLGELHGDEEYYNFYEETGEFYLNEYDLKPGYYIYWAQGGKGTYFEGSVELPADEEFDPKKLRFETIDFLGNTIIQKVYYGEEEIHNFGGEWDVKWADYSVHHIEESK